MTVLYESDGKGIATLTLNRPERRNGLTPELIETLGAMIERAASDDAVRVVILTGAGGNFTVGADLANVDGWMKGAPFQQMVGWGERAVRIARLLHDMPKVTIASINGSCAGAGLSMACACDLRYAGTGARFSTGFITSGLSSDYGGTWTLPRIVGATKARELFLLGDKFDATEAERMGLITRSLPDDQLTSYVAGIAQRLIDSAPLTLQAIKQNLNDAEVMSFSDALNREIERLIKTVLSEDGMEAARAFVEHRKPVFKSK